MSKSNVFSEREKIKEVEARILNLESRINFLGTKPVTGLTDLNHLQLSQNFNWSLDENIANKPCDAGRCYCFQGYGTTTFQLAIRYIDSEVYVRSFFASTWSSWRKL